VQINIVAVGSKAPSWIDAGVTEYLSRMPHECSVTLKTVAVTKRSKNISVSQAQQREQDLLIKNTPNQSYLIALDEHGKTWETAELAAKMQIWLESNPIVTFYIGGPDGFSKDFLKHVDLVLSLSSLTMPHMLARLVLVEQLYRAWTVIQGHPYHRV